jgi:hypothetical protein
MWLYRDRGLVFRNAAAMETEKEIDNGDTSDYFDALHRSSASGSVQPVLPWDGAPQAGVCYEVELAAGAFVSRTRLRQWREAGVTHVRTFMDGCANPLHTAATLRRATEYGLHCEWKLFIGHPARTAEDYAQLRKLLISLRHLEAPRSCEPLKLARSSVWFRSAAVQGFRALRPLASYARLYPFEDEALARSCPWFDFAGSGALAGDLHALCEEWRRPLGRLSMVLDAEQRLHIQDERPGSPATLLLDGWRRQVFLHCDALREEAELLALAPGEDVTSFLHEMNHLRLLEVMDGRWLLLPCATGQLRSHLEEREQDSSAVPARPHFRAHAAGA